ncbi:cytochrome P450 3A8-like [Branchiostoma floridae]|uniref:Cytochrome P450 3A8-like n=1 Tax=Branchiostoma floridae TaxID=7739 RepID=A0A9J7LLR3_BRAFL|nr:cytochrome P450 3A8-like [Branchiostoma floridae]
MACESLPMSVSWGLLAAFICLVLLYGYRTMSVLQKLGVRGPTPLPFVGNLLTYRKGQNVAFREWRQNYGRVYGMYEGLAPKLVITDPEIVKQVFVKDFSNFPMRMPLCIPIGLPEETLIFADFSHHKRRRGILSPAFTAGKVKLMVPLVNRCADFLMENLDKLFVEETTFDAKQVFSYLTLDVMASTAFGVEVNSQKDPQHAFVVNARKVDLSVVGGMKPSLIIAAVLSMVVPMDVLEKWGLTVVPADAVSFFHSILETILTMRIKQQPNERRMDLLELMRAAREEHCLDLPEEFEKSLSADEVTTDAISFFLAGYDTIAGLLGTTAVNLARYSDMQDKLLQEVATVTEEQGYVQNEDIQKMEYLDMFLMETLRMDSGARFPRLCTQDTEISPGLTVPAGVEVIIDSDSLHIDPEYWPEPETFIPERFTKEESNKREPFTFIPFGQGPRTCIGMHLALMATKITLVRILQKYRFVAFNVTVEVNELNKAADLRLTDHGLGFFVRNQWVKLERLDY